MKEPVAKILISSTKIVVAQLGARQDYTIPIALQNLGYLERFYTDVYLQPREATLLRSLSQVKQLRQLTEKFISRHNPSLNPSKVVRFNTLGFHYIQALKQANSSQAMYRAFINYGQELNQAVLRYRLPEITHIYAFDHAALNLFQALRSQGIRCILDQIYPALYEEQIEQEEEENWTNWSLAPRTPFYQSSTFQEWREIQLAEWQLADTVIVASQYSFRAIALVEPTVKPKLRVVPLTVNLSAYFPYQRVRDYQGDRPLRVLFVGTVNLRKGIPYLLSAFQKIKPDAAQLRVVGGIQIKAERIAQFQDQVIFEGPVPHVQIPKIYSEADLFIFPTISDGFGAVMLEAMATGLPVIATDYCGDIVEDGVNGYQIPIRQPDAIVEKIYHLIQEPELLTHLSQGAIATSQQYSLQKYQSRLSKALGLVDQAVN